MVYVKRALPPRKDNGQRGRVFIRRAPLNRKLRPKQLLSRFTVLWVNTAGVPFSTAGFTCRASSTGGTLLATANFDNFGTAIFNTIPTPTARTLVIRTFDADDNLFRTRTVRSGISAFAIIG
ncbi:hypothetical protein [Paenibacillus sedimenti]|uniref:Uncharacterized protein n=1 Tax=Paenibacillus sedimenti TaxID=2770274 RepID=A0A926KT77_9BACL|nr:hypothetical protein [Paenibacillus sedimenti]MBD0383689.1 hypothetical protein [Paenibacillus sedimenti]